MEPVSPLKGLEMLAIVSEPRGCKEKGGCLNGPSHSAAPKCNDCRLSPTFWGMFLQPPGHKWKPISHTWKHPVLEQEKRDANRRKVLERQQVLKNKDRDRQAVLKSATQAESRTQKEVIKATRNSGRVNRDGDAILTNKWVADTKLQSTRENPVVLLSELDKVRQDAKRNNYPLGLLVLRNKNNRGVVVLDEKDLGLLVKK